MHTHTHTRLTALCPGLPGWSSTRKVKPFWILLKQETVSGSGISWAICKSAPRSRQMPAPHHSVFLQAGCPSCRPTNSVKALKVGLHHMHSLYVSLSVCLLYTTMSCAKSLKRLKRSRCHLECWHGWAKGTVFLVGPGSPWGNFGCVSCEAGFCQIFWTTCFFYDATWNWMTCNVLMYHKQIVNLNMMARKTEATVFDFHIC